MKAFQRHEINARQHETWQQATQWVTDHKIGDTTKLFKK